MEFTVRPAQPNDIEEIASFATETFEWGDYIVESFSEWLADERGIVHVAETDRVVAMGRTVMLSDREAWLHAARVDPEYRRRGLGSSLNDAGAAWAHQRGAVVARLLVEDWNTAASAQVVDIGYRPVAQWTSGHLQLDADVQPRSNGHKRLPGEERLAAGRSAEADIAWMSWSSGETARAGRELFPVGWHFRKMRPGDLAEAARTRSLWHCPSGWVIAAELEPNRLFVPWISTSDLDVDRLLRALGDLAEEREISSIRLMVPRVDWMIPAIERAGFSHEPNTIYARDLLT